MSLTIRSVRDDEEVQRFLDRAGRSLATFRYYEKRGVVARRKHLTTLVGLDENDDLVAYGHLDVEEDETWLGVCVVESKVGCGYGEEMMKALLDAADAFGCSSVRLSVDVYNTSAVGLYEKMGFSVSGAEVGKLFMKREKNGHAR